MIFLILPHCPEGKAACFVGLPAWFVHLLFPLIKQIPVLFVYSPLSHVVICLMKIDSVPNFRRGLDGCKVFSILFASDWFRYGHDSQFEPVRHLLRSSGQAFLHPLGTPKEAVVSLTLSHIASLSILLFQAMRLELSKHVATSLMKEPAHRGGKMDKAILWNLSYFWIFSYMI